MDFRSQDTFLGIPLSMWFPSVLILPLLLDTTACCGPVQLSRYRDSLRAGRSGDRIPVGGEIFRFRPNRPWGPPSLLYNWYRVFVGGKAAGAWR